MKLVPVTAFLVAVVAVTSLLSFAVVSIDRSAIERVSIVGDLSAEQLASLKENLDSLELAEAEPVDIRERLSELEWVHHVNVRKGWPSGVDLEVHVEKVIAYWNDKGFINEEGGSLYSDLIIGGDLPHLYGPVGSEQEVMDQYQQLSGMLSKYGHEIKVLKVTERGSWSIETGEGVEVLLGKEDLKARMKRFLVVSERLQMQGNSREVDRMDARYINGVAVEFADNNHMKLAEVNNNVGEQNL